MSKRLQVLLDEKEMRDIQRTAKRQQMTVAEWVRQALRAAHRQVPLTDTEVKKKLGVVRTATRYDFPTGDVDQILREIDQGYQVKRTLHDFHRLQRPDVSGWSGSRPVNTISPNGYWKPGLLMMSGWSRTWRSYKKSFIGT